MRRSLSLGTVGLVVAALGCGGKVEVSTHGGAEAGSAGANAGGTAAGPGGAGGQGQGGAGGGAGTSPGGAGGSWTGDVGGHYMQMMIGNCINAEEWLSLSPPYDAVQTLVDRNFCGAHSLTKRPGSFSLDAAHVLHVEWAGAGEGPAGQFTSRDFTAALVSNYPYTFGQPVPPDYEQGKGALNAMAYAHEDGTLTWRRVDETVAGADAQGKKHTRKLTVEVSFVAPLTTPPEPTACVMNLFMTAGVYYDEPANPGVPPDEQGDMALSVPCTCQVSPMLPWVRVTADGFEQSDTDGSWTAYLDSLGYGAKLDGEVEDMLYGAFRPILYFEPGAPDLLFHDIYFAWYMRMQSPPPLTAD